MFKVAALEARFRFASVVASVARKLHVRRRPRGRKACSTPRQSRLRGVRVVAGRGEGRVGQRVDEGGGGWMGSF